MHRLEIFTNNVHQPTHLLLSSPTSYGVGRGIWMLQSFFSPKLVILMVLFLYGRFTTSTAQEITVSSGFLSTHMIEPTLQDIFYIYVFISSNVFIHLTLCIVYSLLSDCRKKDNKIETLTLNFPKWSPFFTFAKFRPWESRNSHILYLLCRAFDQKNIEIYLHDRLILLND